MHKLRLSEYDLSEWRLFIDVPKRSLTKTYLVHFPLLIQYSLKSLMNISKHFCPGSSTRNTNRKCVAILTFCLWYWVSSLDKSNINALCAAGTIENNLISRSRRTGRLETSWSSVRKTLHIQVSLSGTSAWGDKTVCQGSKQRRELLQIHVKFFQLLQKQSWKSAYSGKFCLMLHLKVQWVQHKMRHGKFLYMLLRRFLVIRRVQIAQVLSTKC